MGVCDNHDDVRDMTFTRVAVRLYGGEKELYGIENEPTIDAVIAAEKEVQPKAKVILVGIKGGKA